VKAKADGNPKTIEGYCKSFRKIVADIQGVDNTPAKFDYRSGGRAAWLGQVHSTPLAVVVPARVQAWKRSFLARAGNDPVALLQAKVSVNFFLRQARNLFSADVIRHLDVQLPDPLPLTGIQFEPRQSLKYRSDFDIQKLIRTARDELSEHQPELFKIFLLATMAGLRRKEIDLLEWEAFRWEYGVIRIEATRWFQPKSEDSIGDIQIDPELLEIFRSYHAAVAGRFVIDSAKPPRPGVTYQYYRCQELFESLTKWLRKNGVKGNKPLHILRKEYDSQICAIHGIHAASRALRHADIRVTNQYYTDSRVRVTPGMGHLLRGTAVPR
jgi:integrase